MTYMQYIAAFFSACSFIVAVWFWVDIRSPKNLPDRG